MAEHWLSLGFALVGLGGIYALLRPIAGPGALPTADPTPVHAIAPLIEPGQPAEAEVAESVKAMGEPHE